METKRLSRFLTITKLRKKIPCLDDQELSQKSSRNLLNRWDNFLSTKTIESIKKTKIASWPLLNHLDQSHGMTRKFEFDGIGPWTSVAQYLFQVVQTIIEWDQKQKQSDHELRNVQMIDVVSIARVERFIIRAPMVSSHSGIVGSSFSNLSISILAASLDNLSASMCQR